MAGGLCSRRKVNFDARDVSEGRFGRERATVERRRRQAVGGTNKLIGGASDSTVRRFNPAHHVH